MQKVVSRDGMGMVRSALKHTVAVAAQAKDQGDKYTLYTHNSASSVGVSLLVPGPAWLLLLSSLSLWTPG